MTSWDPTICCYTNQRQLLLLKESELSLRFDGTNWQVFFLPYRDGRVFALCPLTGVVANGKTIDSAARKWTELARARYPDVAGRSFELPQCARTTRKVWCGGPHDSVDIDDCVYVVDVPGMPGYTVVRPYTDAVTWIAQLEAFADLYPDMGLLFDERVDCSYIMSSVGEIEKPHRLSLTPHHFSALDFGPDNASTRVSSAC
jgi:hypothetical protein